MNIIGEHDKKKHKKKTADYKGSTTMYCTGNTDVNNGPTTFVMKGKKRHARYSEKFLENEGYAPGLIIVMTKNAFIIDAAWETMTDFIIRGYRSMPYAKENSQWWKIEIFDDFGAYLNNLPSLKEQVINQIPSLKKEGGSSSFNQAYGREVTKADKNI